MASKKKLCLIVDDQEFDRSMMRRVFAHEWPDFPLVIARNLEEARARLAEGDIGMVFLDNVLPDGMGIDFVQEMSTSDRMKSVPVVLVSDFPTPFMHAKAKAANVYEVWSKRQFAVPALSRVMKRAALMV
ncbi:response regulator [Sagittula salina]|uniref:Response regulator n=1 Tax=Sagittula salina TaxID=2820268 RepID=A0A940S3Q8_9RHOB|nr:response regulator [Sagittula salina]MBP0483050.1 response regulator [Sagittula salina]